MSDVSFVSTRVNTQSVDDISNEGKTISKGDIDIGKNIAEKSSTTPQAPSIDAQKISENSTPIDGAKANELVDSALDCEISVQEHVKTLMKEDAPLESYLSLYDNYTDNASQSFLDLALFSRLNLEAENIKNPLDIKAYQGAMVDFLSLLEEKNTDKIINLQSKIISSISDLKIDKNLSENINNLVNKIAQNKVDLLIDYKNNENILKEASHSSTNSPRGLVGANGETYKNAPGLSVIKELIDSQISYVKNNDLAENKRVFAHLDKLLDSLSIDSENLNDLSARISQSSLSDEDKTALLDKLKTISDRNIESINTELDGIVNNTNLDSTDKLFKIRTSLKNIEQNVLKSQLTQIGNSILDKANSLLDSKNLDPSCLEVARNNNLSVNQTLDLIYIADKSELVNNSNLNPLAKTIASDDGKELLSFIKGFSQLENTTEKSLKDLSFLVTSLSDCNVSGADKLATTLANLSPIASILGSDFALDSKSLTNLAVKAFNDNKNPDLKNLSPVLLNCAHKLYQIENNQSTESIKKDEAFLNSIPNAGEKLKDYAIKNPDLLPINLSLGTKGTTVLAKLLLAGSKSRTTVLSQDKNYVKKLNDEKVVQLLCNSIGINTESITKDSLMEVFSNSIAQSKFGNKEKYSLQESKDYIASSFNDFAEKLNQTSYVKSISDKNLENIDGDNIVNIGKKIRGEGASFSLMAFASELIDSTSNMSDDMLSQLGLQKGAITKDNLANAIYSLLQKPLSIIETKALIKDYIKLSNDSPLEAITNLQAEISQKISAETKEPSLYIELDKLPSLIKENSSAFSTLANILLQNPNALNEKLLNNLLGESVVKTLKQSSKLYQTDLNLSQKEFIRTNTENFLNKLSENECQTLCKLSLLNEIKTDSSMYKHLGLKDSNFSEENINKFLSSVENLKKANNLNKINESFKVIQNLMDENLLDRAKFTIASKTHGDDLKGIDSFENGIAKVSKDKMTLQNIRDKLLGTFSSQMNLLPKLRSINATLIDEQKKLLKDFKKIEDNLGKTALDVAVFDTMSKMNFTKTSDISKALKNPELKDKTMLYLRDSLTKLGVSQNNAQDIVSSLNSKKTLGLSLLTSDLKQSLTDLKLNLDTLKKQENLSELKALTLIAQEKFRQDAKNVIEGLEVGEGFEINKEFNLINLKKKANASVKVEGKLGLGAALNLQKTNEGFDLTVSGKLLSSLSVSLGIDIHDFVGGNVTVGAQGNIDNDVHLNFTSSDQASDFIAALLSTNLSIPSYKDAANISKGKTVEIGLNAMAGFNIKAEVKSINTEFAGFEASAQVSGSVSYGVEDSISESYEHYTFSRQGSIGAKVGLMVDVDKEKNSKAIKEKLSSNKIAKVIANKASETVSDKVMSLTDEHLKKEWTLGFNTKDKLSVCYDKFNEGKIKNITLESTVNKELDDEPKIFISLCALGLNEGQANKVINKIMAYGDGVKSITLNKEAILTPQEKDDKNNASLKKLNSYHYDPVSVTVNYILKESSDGALNTRTFKVI